ncbi:hypothetical protein MRX96_056137 [Rhipicephalus microplus]
MAASPAASAVRGHKPNEASGGSRIPIGLALGCAGPCPKKKSAPHSFRARASPRCWRASVEKAPVRSALLGRKEAT